jgi:uncharacterized protein
MKKSHFRSIVFVVLLSYILFCLSYYFFQQYFLFTNTKLVDPTYNFDGKFEERNILTRDGKKLNGLLFKSKSSKGLIFYLHGGGHALDKWGKYATTYTNLQYDIFFLDYRGFGKSDGDVPTEKQLYSDVQDAYNNIKTAYNEDRIVVFGYSLGTAPAAMLAATNSPVKLILQAPYYSGSEAVKNNYPFIYSIIPSFLLKYKLETYKFIQQTKAPIVIFHGDKDSVFSVEQAYRLKKFFKPNDELILLKNQGHNGFTENEQYLMELKRVFSSP